jgi:hypothetical protein
MIARKTFQLTPPNRPASPVPVTAEVTTCVVDTGRPRNDAIYMTMAPPHSALKPLMGWSVVIFSSSVRISRKDLTDRMVPIAMAEAALRMTHSGKPFWAKTNRLSNIITFESASETGRL